MDEKAEKQALRPESGFRKRPAIDYALRMRTGELPLVKTETTIGRSPSCDLVLESALVSRRHARLVLSESGLFLEDLGSRNGIVVNAMPVRGSARLSVGDRIRIGAEILEVLERPTPRSYLSETLNETPALSLPPGTHTDTAASNDDDAGDDDATGRADILELLRSAFEKTLTLGRVEDAEHMVSSHLTTRLQEAKIEGRVSNDMVARAARCAIKLAVASEKPGWLDYVVALYAARGEPMPLAIIDEIYSLVRTLRGIDRALLREYVATLRANAGRYNAEARFLLQRVEGLERLANL